MYDTADMNNEQIQPTSAYTQFNFAKFNIIECMLLRTLLISCKW